MIKFCFFVFLFVSTVVFVLIYSLGKSVSDNYKISVKDNFSISSIVPVTAVYTDKNTKVLYNKKAGDTFKVDLKMFGVIPFSSTTVEVVDKMHVAVLGNPFGMKIYTDGVLVIELSNVETAKGVTSPANDAGIRVGDYIKSVDGIEITCNEDLSELVMGSLGEKMKFEIIRNGKVIHLNLIPKKDKNTDTYRAGIWVRDSSAGIGTLTFYSPSDNIICGLGHGISDEDTGEILTINSGELVCASITDVKKGVNGTPGELIGRFNLKSLANIISNNERGVFGGLNGTLNISTLTEVAHKQEVKEGNAQVLTTVKGDKPKLYSCKISQIKPSNSADNQNFTVTVTDKELIDATGGIVQGMSGSPLVQNGKLIGAITHVLVDDPTTGYAIFAENMLETAQSVANSEKLRDAS